MMRTVIASDQSTPAAPEGYKLAFASNAGLPAGQARYTFLPESAFVKEGTVAWRVRGLMQNDIDGVLEDIVESAMDLVALWKAQKIAGLPRSERNAAIEETRNRLIAACDNFQL